MFDLKKRKFSLEEELKQKQILINRSREIAVEATKGQTEIQGQLKLIDELLKNN